MRQLFLAIMTILWSSVTIGQSNIFPDTFPNSKEFKSILVKSQYLCRPGTKLETTGKYIFDKSGNNTERTSICDNKVCGRNIYTYSNNQLISHKNFNTWTSLRSSVSESRWDSTLLSRENTFEYKGDKLVSYKVYRGEMKELFFETQFTYNSQGKISSENSRTFYDSITQNLETVHYAIHDKKEYVYSDTIVSIKYYRNNILQATEEIETLRNGKILNQTLKSVNGTILSKNSNRYNNLGQLVEINTVDTGYDGFGNGSDSISFEKTLLKYDETGKLTGKEHFNKGRICYIEKYQYSK